MNWTGFESKLFNVGSHRRKIGLASADANFFSATNADAKRIREEMAMAVQGINPTISRNDIRIFYHMSFILHSYNSTHPSSQPTISTHSSQHIFSIYRNHVCMDQRCEFYKTTGSYF